MTNIDATIVVCDDDPFGLEIRSLADEWVAARLMTPCLWVTPRHVDRPAAGPPIITCARLGRDGADLDLLQVLSAQRMSLLRVVVLQALTHERASAEHLVRACQDVASLVRRSMPSAVEGASTDGGTRLLRVNVMVPESDLKPQNRDILQAEWEFNVLVSPEDRADIDRANTFVRQGTNMAMHALAAAVEVGALWRGAGEGPFDQLMRESQGGSEVFVIRSQIRLVRGDVRRLDLSRAVISLAQQTPDGVTSVVKWGVPAAEGEQWAASTAERLFTMDGWKPTTAEWNQPQKPEVGFRSVIASWARFQMGIPSAIAGLVRRGAAEVFGDVVTGTFVGSEGDVRARLTPLTPGEAEIVARRRLKQSSSDQSTDRLEQEASNWIGLDAGGWRLLRSICLGLVDGSQLPDGITRRTRGDLEEVLAPRFVVPHPDDGLTSADGPVRLLDIKRALAASEMAQTEEATAPTSAALDEPLPIGTETVRGDPLPAPEPESIAADASKQSGVTQTPPGHAARDEGAAETVAGPTFEGEHEMTAESPAAAKSAEPVSPGEPVDSGQPAPATETPKSAEPSPSSAADEAASWLYRRRHTFMGRVAERAADVESSQNAVADEAMARLQTLDPPSTKSIERARRRLVVMWGVGVFGLLAFVVVAVVTLVIGGPFAFIGLPLALLWPVVAIVLALAGGTVYFRAIKAYDWQVTQQVAFAGQATTAYVQARREARRWASIYQGVLDWGEILAELLHRPWSSSALVKEEYTLDPALLPAAVAVAEAVPTDVLADEELVLRAVNEVCQQGWVSRRFSEVVELCPGNRRSISDRGSIPADLDLGLHAHGARAALLRTARADVTREQATVQVQARLERAILERRLRLPVQMVERQGVLSDGTEVSDTQFLSESLALQVPFVGDLFTDQARVDRTTKAAMTHLSVPQDLDSPAGAASVVESPGRIVARADLSRDVTADDLCIFAAPQDSGPDPGHADSGDY